MGFNLDRVVPWGRSYNEYVSMFSLTDKDLDKYIVCCGDGPSSFNAELTATGGRVLSIDPLYRLTGNEIKSKIDSSFDDVIEQVSINHNEFVWGNIKSANALGRLRMETMNRFLADFPDERRYIPGELPSLKYDDNTFDMALCSHFLFLYSEQFSLEFHVQSIKEMCRVASETRIFPLLELGSIKSRHLNHILKDLHENNYEYTIETVDYEFQKGGNEMLLVRLS